MSRPLYGWIVSDGERFRLRSRAKRYGGQVLASAAVKDGRKIGSIVGAVLFTEAVRPDEVEDGYDKIWVNDDAGYFWRVGACVSFDRHIPCKGQQAPLFFDVPDDVHMLAQADLRSGVGRRAT
jgi:hypothetical protein